MLVYSWNFICDFSIFISLLKEMIMFLCLFDYIFKEEEETKATDKPYIIN